MPDASLRFKAIAAFAAVYLVWGSTYLAIRFAIETLPGFTMAGVRFLIAGGALYLWARLRGAHKPTLSQWRAAAVVGFLLLLCGNGAVVWAEQRVPSGLAALLIATEPLWIAGLFWASPGGEAPGRKTLLGLGLGFGGAALLSGKGILEGGEALHMPSVLVILFACLAWAAGSLYSRGADQPASPSLAVALQMLAGGAFLSLAGLGFGEWPEVDLGAASGRSLAAFAYLVVAGSLIAFSAYNWLVRNVRPALVATYAWVNPVVAVFLGWLLAGEPVTGRTLGAAALILGAVVLVSLERPRTRVLPEKGAEPTADGERAEAGPPASPQPRALAPSPAQAEAPAALSPRRCA